MDMDVHFLSAVYSISTGHLENFSIPAISGFSYDNNFVRGEVTVINKGKYPSLDEIVVPSLHMILGVITADALQE